MKLKINGVERPVAAAWQNESLLSVLREQLAGNELLDVWVHRGSQGPRGALDSGRTV